MVRVKHRFEIIPCLHEAAIFLFFFLIWILLCFVLIKNKQPGRDNNGDQYIHVYSQTSMAKTSLGPWKFVLDSDSLSPFGLVIAPVQEADGDNLGMSF